MQIICTCISRIWGSYTIQDVFYFCLFGFLRLTRAAYFDLCSAPTAIEQWEFFSVPQLLWHGASFYNSCLRGPLTLAHIAERLEEGLSLPVFYLGLSRLGFEPLTLRLRCERSNRLCHRRGYNTRYMMTLRHECVKYGTVKPKRAWPQYWSSNISWWYSKTSTI